MNEEKQTSRPSRSMDEVIRDSEKMLGADQSPELKDRLTNGKWPIDPQGPSKEGIQSEPTAGPGPIPKKRNISFAFALIYLRNGMRIAREGWQDDFLVMMPALNLPPYNTQGTERKVNDRTAKWIGEDKPLNCQPYIAHYIGEGEKWQPGWIPSQQDIFVDDWHIVE